MVGGGGRVPPARNKPFEVFHRPPQGKRVEQGVLIAWAVGSFILAAAMLACCAWLAYRPPSSRLERRLTSRIGQLEFEWSETFDKMNSLAGRVAKRSGLERKQDASPEPTNGQVRSAAGARPATRSALLKQWKESRRQQDAK